MIDKEKLKQFIIGLLVESEEALDEYNCIPAHKYESIADQIIKQIEE